LFETEPRLSLKRRVFKLRRHFIHKTRFFVKRTKDCSKHQQFVAKGLIGDIWHGELRIRGTNEGSATIGGGV
jgi:hypothetical protein